MSLIDRSDGFDTGQKIHYFRIHSQNSVTLPKCLSGTVYAVLFYHYGHFQWYQRSA